MSGIGQQDTGRPVDPAIAPFVVYGKIFGPIPDNRRHPQHGARFGFFQGRKDRQRFRHRQALKRGETKQEDPIPPVASQLIADAWVLCFDEFSVTDIADAMILSRLFEQLFSRGCVLVATSNVEPDDLYHNGLNRQLFLPFIELLKSRVDVFNLDAKTDYRLEKLQQLPVYLSPLNDETRIAMAHAWQDLTVGQIAHPHVISVK